MATILNTSINLSKVPKDKIIEGKKGKYLPVTITINDDVDQFGQQGSLTVQQSKEQRESKEPKVYLGNVKVVWTNGTFPDKIPYEGNGATSQPKAQAKVEEDLPF